MASQRSLFQRYIAHPRRRWLPSFLGLLVLLASIPAASLDGVLSEFFARGIWRVTLSPILTLYILVLAPIMDRMEAGVVRAFRPLVQIDDAEFERVLGEASRLKPVHEAIAFGVGALFGILRGAVTGLQVSPPLLETMVIMGRERVCRLIDRGIEILAAAGVEASSGST